MISDKNGACAYICPYIATHEQTPMFDLGSLIAAKCDGPAILCVATCIAEPHCPCSLLIVSAVTLIVREQTPLLANDISAFLSCAGFVRCPT